MADEHEQLEALTYDSIVQGMVDHAIASQTGTERPITANDFLEGSIFLALYEGVASPIGFLMYALMVDLPGRFYLNQATGDSLDRLVENFTFGQVVRVPASSGAGEIVFEAEPLTGIPINVELRAPNGVLAKTLVSVSVPSGDTEVSSAAAATVTGSNTNLQAGVELQLLVPIPGVTRVYVSQQWSGGADVQNDESLRAAVIEFLDSLAKGVRPAIILGARKSGYDRAVVSESGSGRVVVYCDDGNPVAPTKLEAARVEIHRFWKAAGARLTVNPYVERPITITAKAFSDGTVLLPDLQAAIAAKWTAFIGSLRMGDELKRLDLITQASTVLGYNGINIDSPSADWEVKTATDEYWTEWSAAGVIYPYEKVTLAGIVWE